MYTKTFSELNRRDSVIAGGKGASLGELTQAGIPVPPGFVLLAGAFERFLEETDVNVEIDSILHTVNHKEMHTVEHASEKIQTLILDAAMPKDIAGEIKKEFKKLGVKFVAVRSSATAEDSASAAWAGQLDSFLNTTKKDLLKNVQRCWASLFTPRAIFYRHEKKLHAQKISVAVVIQKMIESEVSGIAFSVHPVTEDRNQLIIEAGFGLGEAIVSGQITPDSYVVEKQPRRILDKNISVQERQLVRVSSYSPFSKGSGRRPRDFPLNKGGEGVVKSFVTEYGDTSFTKGGIEERNRWVDVAKEKGGKQKLSDKQILELAELVLKIETHYGFPCDIEWAFAQGKFYITQSRPITTLKPQIPAIIPQTFVRDFPLILCQIWGRRYKYIFGKDVGVFPRNIFVLQHGLAFSYRGQTVNYEINNMLLEELKQNKNFVVQLVHDYLKKIHALRNQCSRALSRQEFVEFLNLLLDCWQGFFISLYLPPDERFAKSDRDLAMDFRKQTGDLEYEAFNHIDIILKQLYGDLGSLARYISFEELTNNKIPSKDILLGRQKRKLILVDGDIVNELEFEKLQEKFNFQLEVEEVVQNIREIAGHIACSGRVQGKVRILMRNQDVSLLKRGEILVTSMTVPTFLPAMKRAAAFITDEGGITCHAAIISRELKKPCIIGTKIATKVLKDGDIVEVDANHGVVKVIKRVKSK